ncbi:uncharacterized protein LOC129732738 [Wyeomyia smithii]|uniref:uncharacterized protein LOC129732738 n=1 Tax=Wyeomyia smithii TaxID=174621 RepID=UPI0024680436|nr:uncharacterized protein LOC129732738 [Wyeomyia smithii]
MAFSVVQTRKTLLSKPALTIVPSLWVSEDTVKWPPNNLISLSRNEQAYPGKEWKTRKCKILGHRSSYKQAEQLIEYLEEITDSGDAVQQSRGTRCRPPKKLEKIRMNLYTLKPKNKAANNLCITDVQLELNEINPTPNIVIPEGAMGKADQADSIAIENSSQAEFYVQDETEFICINEPPYLTELVQTDQSNGIDEENDQQNYQIHESDRLTQIEAKIDTQQAVLEKILCFMANINKLLEYQQPAREKEHVAKAEFFSEFESMKKLKLIKSYTR